MIIITDQRCMGYDEPGHPERPARIQRTLARLRGQRELPLTWTEPLPVDEQVIRRAHSQDLVLAVQEATQAFDADTPAPPGIYEHALRSVGGAMRALQAARQGELAFSLMRPPGHHATQNFAMGFCYFNNVAIAVLEALHTGAGRVAAFDFDVHHGNGTESILLYHPLASFHSVHQFPCYPDSGRAHVGDNCFNYPVPPKTPRAYYRKVLQRALEDIMKSSPDLIAVSAGFDAYAHDSIAHGTLQIEDFHWLGQEIRKLGVPAFHVLEGGYSDDLPELIFAYLKGLAGM